MGTGTARPRADRSLRVPPTWPLDVCQRSLALPATGSEDKERVEFETLRKRFPFQRFPSLRNQRLRCCSNLLPH